MLEREKLAIIGYQGNNAEETNIPWSDAAPLNIRQTLQNIQ